MVGPLVLDRAAIAAACERYGVKRLVIFGSAVTERFDESTSDVDFLVEFRDDVGNRFDAYFDLKDSLEALLGRPVDLVSPGSGRRRSVGMRSLTTSSSRKPQRRAS